MPMSEMTEEQWQDMGIKGGVHEWRLPITGYLPRKYVRVFELSDGEVQAETETGYIRRCASVDEAKSYLERTAG